MQRHALEHEGVEREYFVHVPQDTKGALPVVLSLHGYTSTAMGFEYAHDLNARADKAGYFVVVPTGNAFHGCRGLTGGLPRYNLEFLQQRQSRSDSWPALHGRVGEIRVSIGLWGVSCVPVGALY